jgi:hypothetical protein
LISKPKIFYCADIAIFIHITKIYPQNHFVCQNSTTKPFYLQNQLNSAFLLPLHTQIQFTEAPNRAPPAQKTLRNMASREEDFGGRATTSNTLN